MCLPDTISPVIGERYIVLHGGLFADDGVKLHEINALDRFRQPPDSSQDRNDRIFTDILWSDPRGIVGTASSKSTCGTRSSLAARCC